MLGYRYAAAGLDAAQAFFEQWLSPGMATSSILVLFPYGSSFLVLDGGGGVRGDVDALSFYVLID